MPSSNYDVDIRELEPTYKHTLARQANREVEDGREVHLRELTVTLNLDNLSATDSVGQTLTITFRVDHEAETVCTHSVGDAHHDKQSFGLEKLAAGVAAAEEAAHTFLTDVGLEDYTFESATSQFMSAEDRTTGVAVHTNLKVKADD